MMIKACSSFLFMLICFNAIAQKQNIYFLKNDGQQVKLRDSADYMRIVQEPEQGSDLYVVNEHYLDGSKKAMGYSSKIEPPVYEGQYVSYYKNGKKRMIANYKKGKLSDTAYYYYPNGNLYKIIGHSTSSDGKWLQYIKSVKDSLGKDLVINGYGQGSFYDADFKGIIESGVIKNGNYDGEWIGSSIKDGYIYKDVYTNGVMISGERTDNDGTKYQYNKVFDQPEFKGGMNRFYAYLKNRTRYPAECYRKGIEGKVMLKFTVKKDGIIKDIKVMNEVHPLLAEEAVRVVLASPSWLPGKFRGKPANVAYNVPVSFTTGR